MFSFLKLFFFSAFIFSVAAENKIISREYPAESLYYISGMDPEDKHPYETYTANHLKGNFDRDLMRRLKSLGITFDEKSSIKVHRKKASIEFVNSEKNHQRLTYLIKNYEVFNKEISVETTVKIYEISGQENFSTLIKNKLKLNKINDNKAIKLIDSFSLKSMNNKDGKYKSKSHELSLKAIVNAVSLEGTVSVNLTLDKGHNKNEIILKNSFSISERKSSCVFYTTNSGQFRCAVFTFKFKDVSGQKLEPLKAKPVKCERDAKEARFYKLKDIDDIKFVWSESDDLLSKLKPGYKWNAFTKTLYCFGKKEFHEKTARYIAEEKLAPQNLNFSVKVIDVKGVVPSKGFTIDEFKKIDDSKKILNYYLSSPVRTKKDFVFLNNYSLIKETEEEVYTGAKININIDADIFTLSPEFKIFRNLSSVSDGEFNTELRYSAYPGKALLLQISGGDKTEYSRFLVLETDLND